MSFSGPILVDLIVGPWVTWVGDRSTGRPLPEWVASGLFANPGPCVPTESHACLLW